MINEKYILRWLSEFEKIMDKNLKEIFIKLRGEDENP